MFLFIVFVGAGSWQKGTVDKNHNLIIVELENRTNCSNRNQHEVITVDSDWSILIVYPNEKEAMFYIFNNAANQIYKTRLFNDFLREVRNIPNNIELRKIDKCTVPFDFNLPDEFRTKLNQTLEAKSCTLESKIMYCYCCADTVHNRY